jgi:tetratricopeptide (TPR) repeat protein
LIAAALIFSKTAPRIKFVVFGAFWFIVFLLPSFIRPDPGMAADFIEHRVYMPLIGFFILLLEIDVIKHLNFKLKKDLALAGAIIILLGAVTFFHIDNFKDRLSFWLNAAKASPHSSLAHRNLGAMYYLAGEPDRAEPEYRKALELNPMEPMAHNNLGLLYTSRGNFEEAQEEYKKELEINPSYDDAYFNLGVLYYKMGELEMAEKLWRRTVELNPDHTGANTNIVILQKLTSNKEAL